MPDLGQKLTDERVEEINKRLLAVYTEAAKDLQKKAEAHTLKYNATEKRLLAEVKAGKKTQDYVDRWKAGQVFIGKQWQAKVDQMARSLVDTERQAVEIVNGGQLECFADNTNYIEYRIDKDNGFGVNFSLYDETTVKGLIEQEPELMRRRYVDGVACEAWNRKIISNCVTQGILQGESIDKIARRIARDTASTDMKAMVRYARTAMTCAQNAGRLEAMNNSVKRGIYCKKVWLAVGDDRTREAHDELDGQTAEIDEPFDSILGEIMYPGDPNASDENVWNCRCALGYEYPDPPEGWQEEERSLEDEEEEFDEWVEEKQEEAEEPVEKPYENPTLEDMFDGTDIDIDEAREKIIGWMDGDAYQIRLSQQMGVADTDAEYIEKLIKESNVHYEGTLYRGIMADEETVAKLMKLKDDAENDRLGDEIVTLDMLGTSSWSYDHKVADDFANQPMEGGALVFDPDDHYTPVIFHCDFGENDVTLNISSVEGTAGYDQKEVIVSNEAKLYPSYISEKDENGAIHVYLELADWE